MGAGHSGFSLRRAINRRRYFYALVAADPHQAVTHSLDYWVSKGAWGETNGMRDQLAQHGWVGAEVIIGSDLRSLVFRPLLDAIPGINLVPSTAPAPLKRTSQERTEILVAARSCSVGGRPASELWCCEARVVHDDRWSTDAFMDMSLGELAGSLERQGLLLEAPRFFHGGDERPPLHNRRHPYNATCRQEGTRSAPHSILGVLRSGSSPPRDHLFIMEGTITTRRATK